jgi:hypothetical protein
LQHCSVIFLTNIGCGSYDFEITEGTAKECGFDN